MKLSWNWEIWDLNAQHRLKILSSSYRDKKKKKDEMIKKKKTRSPEDRMKWFPSKDGCIAFLQWRSPRMLLLHCSCDARAKGSRVHSPKLQTVVPYYLLKLQVILARFYIPLSFEYPLFPWTQTPSCGRSISPLGTDCKNSGKNHLF